MGDTCRVYYTVDRGLAGITPGSPATYVGMCHIFCGSKSEAFEAGFGHAEEIIDIPNFTDISPVIQISREVVAIREKTDLVMRFKSFDNCGLRVSRTGEPSFTANRQEFS